MIPIERQKRQVDALLRELAAHRWEQAVETFAGEAPAFEDVSANMRFSGKAGIARGYEALAEAFPDLEIEVVAAIDVPGRSIRELIITGTHSGAYQEIDATGRRVRFACACFFQFDGEGRLKTERIYFDNETVLRQIRGRSLPYLPQSLCAAA
jgi:steroid delta-isomerase-like uncharacterized protein